MDYERVTVWSWLGLAFLIAVDIAMVCGLVLVFG